MPSGRRPPRPDQPAPIFFPDRGLGRHLVASVVRDAGFVALPMADVYPHGEDQRVDDDVWIRRAGAESWVALTKDLSIFRDHSAALMASTLRVFALSNASLSGPAMAERFRINLNRIVRFALPPLRSRLGCEIATTEDLGRPARIVRRHGHRVGRDSANGVVMTDHAQTASALGHWRSDGTRQSMAEIAQWHEVGSGREPFTHQLSPTVAVDAEVLRLDGGGHGAMRRRSPAILDLAAHANWPRAAAHVA